MSNRLTLKLDPETYNALISAISVILILFLVICVGTAGFMLIEGWRLFDAVYMSIISLTTVGFQEVHPLSDKGRLFVMFYLIGGLGVALYGLTKLGETLVKTSITHWSERRRMGHGLKSISDHYIVCGFGRMGMNVYNHLAQKRVPVVIIEKDETRLIGIGANSGQTAWLIGDATEDRVLKNAGIDRAKGIAAVLGSDSDNLYIVLSSRLLNPDLQIISRATSENSVDKLYKAGADRVVSPYQAGATRVAQFLINPNVAEIFESVSEGDDTELVELKIKEDSPYAGKTLMKTDFSAKGVIIVAIRNIEGVLRVPPNPTSLITPGDSLVAFGKRESLAHILEKS